MLVHKHNSSNPPLTVTHPQLAKEWHPSKNGPYEPEYFTFGSGIPVWWRCPKGPDHVWKGQIQSRTRFGKGCPFCSGHRVSVTNSLKSLHPEIAREWHRTLNELKPSDVTAYSLKPAWWQCRVEKEHFWKASIANRTSAKSRCPYCAGKKPSQQNNLARLYPEVAKQWHPTKNGKLKPSDVMPKSHKTFWWQCPVAKDHVWQAVASNRVNGAGCPFCSGRSASLDYSLARLFPEIAKQWHPTLNGGHKPSDFAPKSNKYAWWLCPKGSDHIWKSKIEDRTRYGKGCPFCHGKRVSKTNSLASRYQHVAKEWHSDLNGDLLPSAVTAFSRKKVWWQCRVDSSHVWQAAISNRTGNGSGCPYCSGRLVLAE